jgi:hypothetical protein
VTFVHIEKTILAGVLVVASAGALGAGAWAQQATVFFQATDNATARPLTAQEQEKLKDPLFKLVLSSRPDATKLADIEALIQPDPAQRRLFIVHEEIKDPRRSPADPPVRRAVISFIGENQQVQLGSNVMLSVFFNSERFSDSPDLEAWGWDEQNGVYNYYKLDRSGNTTPRLSWKLRATSANADRLSASQRAGTCLACHTTGVPIMKELAFPWNNWHSTRNPADYLTTQGPAPERWPVASDARFTHLGNAQELEPSIKGAIAKFNQRRFSDHVKADGQGGFAIQDARRLLRPLFITTEINLASAFQTSGLHPIAPGTHNGPNQRVQVPASFFLVTGLLSSANLGISEAAGFKDVAVLEPAEYKALVEAAGLKLQTSRGRFAGDTHFAWFTPELGFVATDWVDKLLEQKVISPAFAAASLAIDLENPVFSDARASLIEAIPDSFTATPGAAHPDALTREVIARLESANPTPGSAKAEFLALLKNPDPVQEVKARVIAYKDRVGQQLGNPATRQAELQRLFRVLGDRRQRFAGDNLFGSLVESGALLPMP